MSDEKKDQQKLAPPQWLGRPIVDNGHVQDLETRAAMNEFGHKMPRHQAEQAAHDSYVQEQRERAAAHHLAGMKAAMATGNHEDAKKHWALYDMHLKALGKESIGPVPPEVEKRMMDENGSKPLYRFKAHKGDLYALHEPSKDQAPPQGQPIQKGNFDGPEFDQFRRLARQQNAADKLHAGKPRFAAGQAVLPDVEAIRRATNADYTGHVGRVVQPTRPNSAGHRYLVEWHGPKGTHRSEVNEGHLAPTESNVVSIHKSEETTRAQREIADCIRAGKHLKKLIRGTTICSHCKWSKHIKASVDGGGETTEPRTGHLKVVKVESFEKAEAKQCKWKLGERRCKRMVTTDYCHDHVDHWANKIKQKEAAVAPMEKADLPPAGTGQLAAPPALLHNTVEGFVGGLKALPKGSPERGRFITQHMNHGPFLSALKAHPQGQQIHAQLTSHLNGVQNAGFKPGATKVVAKSEQEESRETALELLKSIAELAKGKLIDFPGNPTPAADQGAPAGVTPIAVATVGHVAQKKRADALKNRQALQDLKPVGHEAITPNQSRLDAFMENALRDEMFKRKFMRDSKMTEEHLRQRFPGYAARAAQAERDAKAKLVVSNPNPKAPRKPKPAPDLTVVPPKPKK